MAFGTLVHKEVENYHKGRGYNAELLTEYIRVYELDHHSQCEVAFSHDFTHPFTGEELGADFRGIIDRLTPTMIYDVKTASKSIEAAKVDPPLGKAGYSFFDSYGLQATAYAYYVWQTTGNLLPFTFIVWRKDWSPGKRFKQVYPMQPVTRTKQDFALFFDLCKNVLKDIQDEQEFPCVCPRKEHAWAER